MHTTQELQRMAIELIPDFDGVYPINHLPITYKKSYKLIVNLDSDNLPGTHWIAVFVRPNKKGFVLDSLGYPPPLKLQHWLNIRGIEWECNKRQVQASESTMCGYYCIYFLWFMSSSTFENEHFVNIINILFPPKSIYTYYDSIVKDFANIMKI